MKENNDLESPYKKKKRDSSSESESIRHVYSFENEDELVQRYMVKSEELQKKQQLLKEVIKKTENY